MFQRKSDIFVLYLILTEAFLKEYGSEHGIRDIEENVWTLLKAYDFPGNICELKSIVHHAVNLARGTSIFVHHLPASLTSASSLHHPHAAQCSPDAIVPLADIEKNYILKVYRQTGRNKIQTPRLLKIGLNTLRRKRQFYGVS